MGEYREVHVLILSWEDDDLGVIKQILQLAIVFTLEYELEVDKFMIPSNNPEFVVMEQLKQFVDKYSQPGNLLIVYYGGHGGVKTDETRATGYELDSHAVSVRIPYFELNRLANELEPVDRIAPGA
jgi:hypothetical protein